MDIGAICNYADYLNTAVNANTEKVKSTISRVEDTAEDEKLLDACKQFEAYLLEQVFKAMDKTVIRDEGSALSYGSNSSLVDYFKEMTLQQVAEDSTDTHGLGLAQMLYNQMKINYGLDKRVVDPSTIPTDGTVASAAPGEKEEA